MNRIKRLYILGAGASCPYGLPTMKTITWEIRRYLAPEDRAILDEALDETFGSIPERPEDSPDLEEFLNRLDARSLVYLPQAALSDLTTVRLKAAAITLSALRTFIRERSMAAAGTSGPYDVIVKSLTDGDAIVSFNWDPLIEIALARAGRKFSYLQDSPKEGITLLLKPHGSITWFALLEHELLTIDLDAGVGIVGDNLQYYMLHLKDPLAEPALGNSSYFAHKSIAPLPAIVPPGCDRSISVGNARSSAVRGGHAGLMHETWAVFRSSVTSAEDIITIGYSLPGTDAAALETLKPYRERGKRLWVIDRNPRVVERYQRHVCETATQLCARAEELDGDRLRNLHS